MKKQWLYLTALIAMPVVLVGCVSTPPRTHYQPVKLNEAARGVTVGNASVGCVVLGKVEGADAIYSRYNYTLGNTLSALRKGAFNDLRNNAYGIAGATSLAVLTDIEESGECVDREGNREFCLAQNNPNRRAISYSMRAELFGCPRF